VNAARPKRILIGKVGLDGHDRGAKFIVRALRNAGYEVIYTDELFARVAELLAGEGVANIVLFAGGVIPDKDIPSLKELGFRRVFTPGCPLADILAGLEQDLHGQCAGAGEVDA
jgi:methylmalonyl-CoA mutase C-terminal domain/subunit